MSEYIEEIEEEVIDDNLSYEDDSETELLDDDYEPTDEELEGIELEDEYEQEEIELPEYTPDELIPPAFENEEDELAFYRENYAKAIGVLGHPDAQKFILEQYENSLIEKEADVERLKALKQAFDKDPTAAMKFYFPEALEQRGYRTIIQGKEAEDWVTNRMADEFGEDFLDRFNAEDANLKPKSESAKMKARYEQVQDELNQHNEKAKQVEESLRPLSQQEIQQKLDVEYKEHFAKDLTKDEFEIFLAKANETPLSLQMIFKAMYHDVFIEVAQEEAYKRGKQDAIKQLKGSIKTQRVQVEPKKQEDIVTERFKSPIEMYYATRHK